MEKLIKRVIIIVLVFFAGRWGVEQFMVFVDARYAEREQMAEQIGKQKAAVVQRTIETGQAARTEALRQQLGTGGSSPQGAGTSSPVNVGTVRQQVEQAQSRPSEALTP